MAEIQCPPGRPEAPVVTSRSTSERAREHEVSWRCDSVSRLLEYEIGYKNKWNKVDQLAQGGYNSIVSL